ncbi:sensor histidine kinase [Paenibacillus piri]|uniref:Heme sensor protein HssS n=1 Tax=Paenibacillus piri TaxID=2547395 RepID=A0A4R5KWM7_9BACL|nr:HAMP domain-containing sensor histidine kinase [Paenibacillus piri]TDF99437.1 HAMP domain-containing sensor histidine kinase [Paenibacillus piri]
MNKAWHITLRILGVIGFIIFANLCGSAVYWIASQLFQSMETPPSEYIRWLITSIGGFLLFAAITIAYGLIMRPRQMDFFQILIDAVRQIARGDFNVKLTIKRDDNFGKLIDSINHMAVQLNQMEQMRQEFISNVSHEIQSPLTSIAGFARVLQEGEPTLEERMHYLSIIETESKRLSKLSENLLKLTSLESDQHPFEPKRYRLDKQLRNLILACEPQWSGKSIEMEASLAEMHIEADEDMMSQVWVNLLNNSIKFTTDGGTIRVDLQRRDRQAVIRIADTGIGMSAEDCEHVFERFFKVDKSRNRELGGSGLGLSIVKKIIDLHKGAVSVQSKPGEGTIFTVVLPVEP